MPNKNPVFRPKIANQLQTGISGVATIEITIKIPVPKVVETLCIWPLLLYRRLRYGYAFRKIRLTQGQYAIIDPDDFDRISSHKWYAALNGHSYYAGRNHRRFGKRIRIQMHRRIMGAVKGVFVDHININSLDNRKANLRFVTRTQNNWNTRRGMNEGSSKYKGVNWNKRQKKWRAEFSHNRKKIHLGYFNDERAAARTYNKAVSEHRGEFAVLNDV